MQPNLRAAIHHTGPAPRQLAAQLRRGSTIHRIAPICGGAEDRNVMDSARIRRIDERHSSNYGPAASPPDYDPLIEHSAQLK